MPPFAEAGSGAMRILALAAVLALAGCSEYLDRRQTITPAAGDALATAKVTHMVDPWPRESADRNIAFNGPRMQSAVERYRTNQVIQPRGTGTSASYGDSAVPQAPANTKPLGPTVNAPPTK